MKIRLIFLVIVFFVGNLDAQISITQEKYNALREIQSIPEGMTYDEFLKIQRNLDWSKLFIASVVPGYIHFYLDHPKTAWAILGARVIGYGLMTYAIVDQYDLLNNVPQDFINAADKQHRQNNNAIIFTAGAFLNIAGLFYDWAAGAIIFESDRNYIYFKYGLDPERRKKFGLSYNNEYNFPAFTFRLNL